MKLAAGNARIEDSASCISPSQKHATMALSNVIKV
jgi:hypothetical protein